MKIKKIFIGFLVLFTLLFSSQVFAVGTVSASTPPVSAIEKSIPNEVIKGLEIGVFNTKIISQDGNKFKISFNVVNGDVPQAGLKYTIKLIEETKDKGQFLVDSYTPSDVFSIGAKSTVPKETNYTAPSISGTYKLFVFLSNESGYNLGLGFAGEVKLSSNSGLQIIPSTCYLTASGDSSVKDHQIKYTLTQGVDIAKTENLKLSCEVQNSSSTSVNVVPQYETHLRTMNGKVVSAEGGDVNPIAFKAGEKKEVTLILPKASNPQAYDIKVSLKNGVNFSNSVIVHYVIQGASATILKASLDKNYYQRGEVAKMILLWAPSADGFFDSRAGKGTENTTISLTSDIHSSTGGKCIKTTESNLTEISSSHTANIPLNIKSNCKNPKLTVQIKDATGTILDEKEITFESTDIPVQDKSNTKNILLIVLGVIILGGIVFYIINLKKKSNETNNQNETNIQ